MSVLRRRVHPKRKDKTHRMRQHSQERANERYGLDLSKRALNAISSTIRMKQATFISRVSPDRTIWDVSYNGQTLRVVYSKRHKAVVTVLPNNHSPQADSPSS